MTTNDVNHVDPLSDLFGVRFSLSGSESVSEQEEITQGDTPSQQQKQEQTKEDDKVYSVMEACRLHSGEVKVRGIISTVTTLRMMLKGSTYTCMNCNNKHEFVYNDSDKDPKPEFQPNHKEYGINACVNCSDKHLKIDPSYTNAVVIELKDVETYSDIDLLHTILFEEDTRDIQPGEIVIVDGKIHPVTNTNHNKTILPYLYAKSIKYESRKEIILTQADREAIQRFTSLHGSKIIDKLVEMTACNIIGHEDVKRCVLFCEVLTNLDTSLKKINILLLGEPGLSKTEMLRYAVKLNPKSRFESGENSSGKTLTAIISNEEGEGRKLNTGAIPAAKGGICAVNEIGRMNSEGQGHFLGVMQEGFFTLNKHGINVRVRAPTAIIGSANPPAGNFQDPERVDIDEIPMIAPLFDRCDYTFVYRMNRDEAYQRRYADAVSEFDNRKAPDYMAYLMKHMMYAKELCSCPIISKEAGMRIDEYYVNVVKDFGSPRVRNTLVKTARAIAMLKLKKVVDIQDAEDTMRYYSAYVKQLKATTIEPVTNHSIDMIYKEVLDVIKESKFALSLEDAAISAAGRNMDVARYLNNKFRLQNNTKLQVVKDRLTKNSSIKLVSEKPLTFEWNI